MRSYQILHMISELSQQYHKRFANACGFAIRAFANLALASVALAELTLANVASTNVVFANLASVYVSL